MKKIITILTFILISCNKTNSYKIAFEEKIQENLENRRFEIESQLEVIKVRSSEQPVQFSRFEIISKKIDTIFSFLSKEISETSNIKLANSLRKKTLIKIVAINEMKELKGFINELEKPINNNIDKLKLLDKIDRLYLEFLKNFTSLGSCYHVTLSQYNQTSVYSTRINDSIVLLNFANNLIKDYPNFFDSRSLIKMNLKNSKLSYASILNNNIIASYYIKSRSDTISLNTSIKTKDFIGITISEDKKDIIIGKETYLKTNYNDFLKMIDSR